MKISKTARQNYILLALAGIFFLIAKGGFDDTIKNGMDALGLFPMLFGGLGFMAFAIALIVRLWDME
jgi:ABC-type proline/glycine betaine transport system permease subunit